MILAGQDYPDDVISERILAMPPAKQARALEALGEVRRLRPAPLRAVPLRAHLAEVDPGSHLDRWHTGKMIEAGQALLDGEIENLMVTAPSRVGKSRTLMQGLPSCRIRNEPRSKVMITCASIDLVGFHSGYARDFSKLAGVELREDSRSKSLWITGQNGMFRAVVFGGGPLGFGWDFLGVDDPFASQEAVRSLTVRNAAWRRFRDFHSRKQARPEGGPGGRLLVQTRLHPDDVEGRLLDALEDGLQEHWCALILRAHQGPKPYSLPPAAVEIEDERKPGEPLCDDADLMAPIEERRRNDPRRYWTEDQGEPPEDAGGGIFRRSWIPIIGKGREDLDRPLDALAAMAGAGEIPPIHRLIRGHDPSGGGSGDPVASVGVAHLAPGHGLEVVLFDPTQSRPPEAAVIEEVLGNAGRQPATAGAEQALPKEGGTGKVVITSLAGELRRRGYRVHQTPTGAGKVALAQPLAAKAAPRCRLCNKTPVDPDELAEMRAGADVCKCEALDIRAGMVAILATPRPAAAGEKSAAEELRDRLHEFDGGDGGDDHQVDAASAGYNASAGPRRTISTRRSYL